MRIGDLVKMQRGYSSHGVILDIGERLCFVKTQPPSVKWVSVLWSDEGPSLEKARDLEVVSELSDEQLEFQRTATEFAHQEVLPQAEAIEIKKPGVINELMKKGYKQHRYKGMEVAEAVVKHGTWGPWENQGVDR